MLQIEHVGQLGTMDGFCMSLLVQAGSHDLVKGARCKWDKLEETEEEKVVRTALQQQPPGCTRLIDLSIESSSHCQLQ